MVSFAVYYEGRFEVGFDRPYPRGILDVRGLLANEGVEGALHRAFLVYLISHNRPMAEVLEPTRKPLREKFKRGFVGMTEEAITLTELETAREAIIAEMVAAMPGDHRRFLVSFKRGEPDWELLGIPEAQHLPAVMWKQRNLGKLPDAKRAELIEALERVLFS